MFHRVRSETPEPQEPSQKPLQSQQDSRPEPSSSENLKVLQPAAREQGNAPSENPFGAQKESEETYEQPKANPTQTKDISKMNQQANEEQEAPISAYARSSTSPAPARTPISGYPGSYTAYGRQSEQSAAAGSERRLTIGAGITLSGEIEYCDYLLVEGTVEAALKGANVLDIAESGVFYGTVEIGEATIAGRFEGDIVVNGRLNITSTGTVTGSISYKELSIEAGAVIDGKITPLSGSPASAKKPASKGKSSSKEASQPASNDGELFSKAAAAE